MTEEYRVALTVNGKGIELSGFPEEFLIKTLDGAVSSLKKVEDIKSLDMTLSYGKVKLSVNNNEIHLGPFPKLIMTNTLYGLVSTLKRVDEKITNLHIILQKI